MLKVQSVEAILTVVVVDTQVSLNTKIGSNLTWLREAINNP